MRVLLKLSAAVFVGLLLSAVGPSQADHQHLPRETLGSVRFPTSCMTDPAQFDRAVALMHSFQFADAIEGFHAILGRDPSCSMAYWGIALSRWGNPFAAGLKLPAQLEQGGKAVAQARAAVPKTDRERGYVEAVAHLYTDAATLDQHARVVGYEDAMSALSTAYPDDVEAAIFYALSLAAAADPADKTYAKQLKAGAMLEHLFVLYPDHPGLAHYIIHAYDVPPLAARAVGAAQRYGAIAPSTPHALHMPSHTFTRVGDWRDSIAANVASAAAARKAGQTPDELHAMDYLVYAYLQTAQDVAAGQLADATDKVFPRFDPHAAAGGAGGPAAAYFARASISARYCLERGAWGDAAKLQVTPSAYPYTEAITYFARGLGGARSKNRAVALSSIASLAQSRDALTATKEMYWANQVEIQRQEVAAWLMLTDGNGPGGVAGMRAAAEREDRTEKSAITPGPLAPARELLGEMLLELKRPAEALREFNATVTKEPNRFRSLYGAAEAAKLAGDVSASQAGFRKLLAVAERADDPGRREITEARMAVREGQRASQ